ncbi:MAG: family N-acetyltransferase [Acidobacteria bacterium]|nr:family N-acetyltransferase [Acidobacteriota bacterium]
MATRLVEGVGRAIAVASYFRIDATNAEVAFAVDDAYQGHGLGAVLLTSVAMLARDQGFARVDAHTLPDNGGMFHVLRASGFEMRIKPQRGCVTVHCG